MKFSKVKITTAISGLSETVEVGMECATTLELLAVVAALRHRADDAPTNTKFALEAQRKARPM